MTLAGKAPKKEGGSPILSDLVRKENKQNGENEKIGEGGIVHYLVRNILVSSESANL